jgi:hypothetical protein
MVPPCLHQVGYHKPSTATRCAGFPDWAGIAALCVTASDEGAGPYQAPQELGFTRPGSS